MINRRLKNLMFTAITLMTGMTGIVSGSAAETMNLTIGAGKAAIEIPDTFFPTEGFVGVHDKLHVRTLLLDNGATRLGLVVVDMTSLFEEELGRISEIVKREGHVESTNLFIAASHNFSSPHIMHGQQIKTEEEKQKIEMQVLNVDGFEKRILYNVAKLYSTRLKKAQNYESLEPVIALAITDFEMFHEFRKVILYWDVREKETLLKYSDDIELIFVELAKFTKTEEELHTITDKWIYFIKHAGELDVIPTSFRESPLRDAFEMANTASLTEEEFELQSKRRDFIVMQRGSIEKARHDGIQEGIGLTAKKMLQAQLPLEMIMKCTGLTAKDIEQMGKS
ncbi:hypothetical protein U14_04694 [Candidatus Moduliflexus flocculans]|uniref:Transposase n=1 Tax=Candidatus Moduliflexus flocculans TaxID=1499966 RepID=A0A0S6W0Y8_9BACT|nr:hypothetical protein U14_04694 [Candidatus Moduliflexus flocculans]